jgi:uncharacterized protein (UPF0128 family)
VYKIYARIVNKRLRTISEALLEEEQNGIRTRRTTANNIFILQQVFEKRRKFHLQTHVAFIDFEKAFDKVNRNKLWTIMEERGHTQHLIRVRQSLYHNSKIIINTGKTKLKK